jgi:hypothetical protein
MKEHCKILLALSLFKIYAILILQLTDTLMDAGYIMSPTNFDVSLSILFLHRRSFL